MIKIIEVEPERAFVELHKECRNTVMSKLSKNLKKFCLFVH